MIRSLGFIGAVAVLSLLLDGCAANPDIATRIREKSGFYSTLKPSDRWDIKRGYFRMGFTTDMVHMAMGPPLRVETCNFHGSPAEFWTYDHQHLGALGRTAPYSMQVLFQGGRAIRLTYYPTSEDGVHNGSFMD